jgi:hypothetical protein
LSFLIKFNQIFISTADAVSGWYLGRFSLPRKILFLGVFCARAGVWSSCSAVPSCSLSACNNSSSSVSPITANSRLVTVSLSLKYVSTKDISSAYFHFGLFTEADWPLLVVSFFRYFLYWSRNEVHLCLYSEPMNGRISYSFSLIEFINQLSVITAQTFLVIYVFA